MTPVARARAKAISRKFGQASKHGDEMRASLARGDWDGAWAAALALKKTLAAADHLIAGDEHATRHEEQLRDAKR